jgi:hypothetical protein
MVPRSGRLGIVPAHGSNAARGGRSWRQRGRLFENEHGTADSGDSGVRVAWPFKSPPSWSCMLSPKPMPSPPRHRGQRQGEGHRRLDAAAKLPAEGSQALPEGEGRCPCKIPSLLPLISARYPVAFFLGRPRPLFPLTPAFKRCTGTATGVVEPPLCPRPIAAAIFDRRSE